MKIKQGFTIIEVLVVIGIIAILTAIIYPSISQIRAKNRDTERVADLSAIQLGLSLYYNQHQTKGESGNFAGYPPSLDDLVGKYVPADAIEPPNDYDEYHYIPLKRNDNSINKCTYYHLATKLELPSAQIDTAKDFDSTGFDGDTTYDYCGADIDGVDGTQPNMYNVFP